MPSLTPNQNFIDKLLRLKAATCLELDQDIAALLGLSNTAFKERKKRGAFPEKDLRAMVQKRPDLQLDVGYILNGTAQIQARLQCSQAQDDELLATCWPNELALVDRLMADAFDIPRDPRSDAYRDGARALLLFKLVDKPLHNPFELGTAYADAWWAGRNEGLSIIKLHLSLSCPA
jgi:hypothetical protein